MAHNVVVSVGTRCVDPSTRYIKQPIRSSHDDAKNSQRVCAYAMYFVVTFIVIVVLIWSTKIPTFSFVLVALATFSCSIVLVVSLLSYT